jgi:hypothetical protein
MESKNKITIDVTVEVYEESGGQYDLIIDFCGEFQVRIEAEPGVNIYPLILDQVYKQHNPSGSDIRITSIIWNPTEN